eukprot:Rhum_TRINITY_DN4092_c0_g2::Rhum_TRINITY_DN4092_c0_g2_i1::g.12879::m.12879
MIFFLFHSFSFISLFQPTYGKLVACPRTIRSQNSKHATRSKLPPVFPSFFFFFFFFARRTSTVDNLPQHFRQTPVVACGGKKCGLVHALHDVLRLLVALHRVRRRRGRHRLKQEGCGVDGVSRRVEAVQRRAGSVHILLRLVRKRQPLVALRVRVVPLLRKRHHLLRPTNVGAQPARPRKAAVRVARVELALARALHALQHLPRRGAAAAALCDADEVVVCRVAELLRVLAVLRQLLEQRTRKQVVLRTRRGLEAVEGCVDHAAPRRVALVMRKVLQRVEGQAVLLPPHVRRHKLAARQREHVDAAALHAPHRVRRGVDAADPRHDAQHRVARLRADLAAGRLQREEDLPELRRLRRGPLLQVLQAQRTVEAAKEELSALLVRPPAAGAGGLGRGGGPTRVRGRVAMGL